MIGKRESQGQRSMRSDLYVEDQTVRKALCFLRRAFKRLGPEYAENELVEWVMSYFEQKYGRILKCERCGCDIKVSKNLFRKRCPKCEREWQNEQRLSVNLTVEERRKKRECEKRCLERMKESGLKWKRIKTGVEPCEVSVKSVNINGLKRCTRELVVRTGTLTRTRDVKFLDYIDSFVSGITGKRMMIRVMSLSGTGDADAKSVTESNLIEPIKQLALDVPSEQEGRST